METIGQLLFILISGIALIALFLILDVFFPRRIKLAKQASENSSGRSFMLGLVNFIFAGAVFGALFVLGENLHEAFFFPGLLIAAILAAGIIFGLSAITHFVGERLFSDEDQMKQKIWGAGVLILACLTPFIGWFIFFPLVAIFGLGALIGSWFPPKLKTQAVE